MSAATGQLETGPLPELGCNIDSMGVAGVSTDSHMYVPAVGTLGTLESNNRHPKCYRIVGGFASAASPRRLIQPPGDACCSPIPALR